MSRGLGEWFLSFHMCLVLIANEIKAGLETDYVEIHTTLYSNKW